MMPGTTPNYGYRIPNADGTDLIVPDDVRVPVTQIDSSQKTLADRVLALETGATATAWTAFSTIWKSGASTLSIGNGTMVSRYKDVGKTRFWEIKLNRGSTTNVGVGDYSWTLPAGAPREMQCSSYGYYHHVSPFLEKPIIAKAIGTLVVVAVLCESGLRIGSTTATWGPGDEIAMWGFYELA